jgi:hypothetical protein
MGEAKRRDRQPCYRATVWLGRRPIRIAVWNGLKDYESKPSDMLLDMIGGPRLSVVQFSAAAPVRLIDYADKADSIGLWARDDDAYRWMVATLRRGATIRADGKPIAVCGRSTPEEIAERDWARWSGSND